jgi:hypothetical protein
MGLDLGQYRQGGNASVEAEKAEQEPEDTFDLEAAVAEAMRRATEIQSPR